MRTINATEFNATCLAVLDDVSRTGERVVILKRGRAVAELVRPRSSGCRPPQTQLEGSVEHLGDVVEPVLPATAWDATRGKLP